MDDVHAFLDASEAFFSALAPLLSTFVHLGNALAPVTAGALQFATARITGNLAQVSSLTKPGAEPHDLELSPRDVARIADADLVVYVSGFQPAVDDARWRCIAALRDRLIRPWRSISVTTTITSSPTDTTSSTVGTW